jgi:hypothetical protein
VLQPYGSLFFDAAPVFAALPKITGASRHSVVILSLRGKSDLATRWHGSKPGAAPTAQKTAECSRRGEVLTATPELLVRTVLGMEPRSTRAGDSPSGGVGEGRCQLPYRPPRRPPRLGGAA